MSLTDRHLGFVEALRAAGLPVSLSEDIDAARAIDLVGWAERERLRTVYAATLVKRAAHRPQFDVLFDLWFPARVGGGQGRLHGSLTDDPDAIGPDDAGSTAVTAPEASPVPPRDGPQALADLRHQIVDAAMQAADGDQAGLAEAAVAAVGRFGAMPGRSDGLAQWSAYQALMRVEPERLITQIVAGLVASGLPQEAAQRRARTAVDSFTAAVQAEALRRLAEQKGPKYVADSAVRPTIDRLDFLSARRSDLVDLRREIYPLARRLATRLTQEHHARRRGPLDFRRTVRASVATGGVPITTHHRPKRPHRSELVVLCDVSGSVANFAQFTLLLVHALRDQFTKIRAFTFVDEVVEVTEHLRPGDDPVAVMERLAASARQAALWGRTNYGRAFTVFEERYADAIGPKSSLLVLGDARSNYADMQLQAFRAMVQRSRNAWWLNPEHPRNWGTGDSVAPAYAQIVPMVECRNLTQLGEFVHDIL